MVSEANNENMGVPQPMRYEVRVGHEVLIVRGLNRSEAIREARRRLCMELPRMWDVIQGLDDSRFGVELVQEPADDSFTDDSFTDDALTDDSLTDDSLTDDSLTDDSLTDDSLTDDSLTDDSLTDDSLTAEGEP